MRYSLLALLICFLWLAAVGRPPVSAGEKKEGGPLKLTEEERKVVAVAEEYMRKKKIGWETVIEVKRPPNRVNVPDWKKYVEDEKHIWKVVYETPPREFKALGARTLFVNLRTNEVVQGVRK